MSPETPEQPDSKKLALARDTSPSGQHDATRITGEHRHSPLFLPVVPAITSRRGWWRRRSRSTVIGGLLIALAIGVSFVYAFRIEAAREEAAAKRSP